MVGQNGNNYMNIHPPPPPPLPQLTLYSFGPAHSLFVALILSKIYSGGCESRLQAHSHPLSVVILRRRNNDNNICDLVLFIMFADQIEIILKHLSKFKIQCKFCGTLLPIV